MAEIKNACEVNSANKKLDSRPEAGMTKEGEEKSACHQ
jgi:hypothetical protein